MKRKRVQAERRFVTGGRVKLYMMYIEVYCTSPLSLSCYPHHELSLSRELWMRRRAKYRIMQHYHRSTAG